MVTKRLAFFAPWWRIRAIQWRPHIQVSVHRRKQPACEVTGCGETLASAMDDAALGIARLYVQSRASLPHHIGRIMDMRV